MMPTIPTHLAQAADTWSDHPALKSVDGHSLSYAALRDQVHDLSRSLCAHGIAPGDRVAVSVPSGPEMATLFLAIASTATCAPLNPSYRRGDIEYYLDDLSPRAVVVPEGGGGLLTDVASERGISVLTVAPEPVGSGRICRILGDATSMATAEPGPDDVALVLHTSGTTGRPKRVPLTHASLVASAKHIAHTLQLSSQDHGLLVMPLFHIHGLVGGLLASLWGGGTVTCAPGFDANRFIQWASDAGATWYTAVPTIHQAILEAAAMEPTAAADISFRFIRSSSASLPPTMLTDMEAQWGAPVIESYGMSEAAHQMTSNPLPPAVRKQGSVGPAAGPDVAVMGTDGRLVGSGERGEVVIRGANVMTGYEQNPDANARAFADGWFRTGDEGVFDADGYLTLTGRLKEMVNRGGETIAPREVDEALLEHPAVAAAVAFAVPHPTLGEDLAAAVVLHKGQAPSEQELRQFIAARLADAKVPSRVLCLNELPKGPTGKLKRIGLHETLAPHLTAIYAAPHGEDERVVAEVFADTLGHEQVGRDDNFFALGGDSIRAIRTVVALAEQVGFDVPVARVFEHPTPALLAAEVARMRAQEAELDDLARALEGLSPEEVGRLLADSGA